MHSMGFIHGDLKCNNLLLKSTRADLRGFTLKISDLGTARLQKGPEFIKFIGNPYFAALEVLERSEFSQVENKGALVFVYQLCVIH